MVGSLRIFVLGTIGLVVLMTQWANFVRAENPSNSEELVNSAGAGIEPTDEETESGRPVAELPKRANQFLRIGRGSHFIRIGRGGASSFLRIGRNPLSQFIRIGKAPSSKFLRIGRSSAVESPELDDLAVGPSSLADSNTIDEDEVIKRASSFLRIGRPNPSTFLRIGKSAPSIDDEIDGSEESASNEIEVPSESLSKRASAFLRIGKIPASSFVRIGRGPYGIDNRGTPRGYLSVGSRFVRIGKREAIPSSDHSRLLPTFYDKAQ